MLEGLTAQKSIEIFESSEACRKIRELRKMQEYLRAQENAGRFEGSGECRKV